MADHDRKGMRSDEQGCFFQSGTQSLYTPNGHILLFAYSSASSS